MKRTVIACLLGMLLLLFATGVVVKKSTPTYQKADINFTIFEGNATLTASGPLHTGLGCGGSGFGDTFGASQNGPTCWVAPGTQHIIYAIRYTVYSTLVNDEDECTYGLASQTGYANDAWTDAMRLSWSTTDVGDTTTATCDTSSIATGSDLEAAGDYCINRPDSPVVFSAGDQYTFLISEVAALTCDDAEIAVHVDREIVQVN